jgi:hypothetical protein
MDIIPAALPQMFQNEQIKTCNPVRKYKLQTKLNEMGHLLRLKYKIKVDALFP